MILDSTEVMANINESSAPAIATVVTYDVFDAAGDGLLPVMTRAAGAGLGETASFDLADGSYRIRVTAEGFLDSWFTASSGRDGDAFLELLRYQERTTFATADDIVVDSVTPANSSWNSQGWTVLHPSSSSISGAVGSDVSAQQGTLLADVAVELYDGSAAPDSGPAATTRTDQNGYYTFLDQAPGSYKVRFDNGFTERWWPETPYRAEAESITLNGSNYFNLAYAIFPAAPVPVDPGRVLTLTGQPALGATLTASPDYIDPGPAGEDCLQRYSWFLDGHQVDGAFGPTFAVPLDAGGKSVTARLDVAGIGCTYAALVSNAVGPVDRSLTTDGTNVQVFPVDSSGGTDVSLKFASVGTPGITTVTRLESGDAFPDGGFFSLADPPLYYDIETTAEFNAGLGVEVCITFDTTGMTGEQHLYHFTDGAWKDITVSSKPGKVCGRTSSFSPFAVGQPQWPFRGFFQPVDNGGVLNAMKAGAAVPVKFGLGGNRGLGILAAEAPSSYAIACPGGPAPDDIEQTVAAGTSSLSYSAASDTYTFVWKTQKDWAGSCRQFELKLNDGTTHAAMFDFRR
ncbi:hypothetical protein J2X42_000886 [Arthrobacter sp. BE255]|nr:hypothetical protein [Arthrobacter sp. BE255]